MRSIFRHSGWFIALPLAVLLGGCARYPADQVGPNAPERTVLSQITVNGQINPNYYYFLAVDTDGDPGTGPVPVATGPELGNGWGVIAPTPTGQPVREPAYYIQYHNGEFQQFVNSMPAGRPFRGEVSQDGRSLLVEFDQALLGSPIPATVQLNWITQESITTPPQGGVIAKQYDGFGFDGKEYLSQLPLDVSQTLVSGQGAAPEELPYLGQYPDSTIENTTNIPDIDLTGWTVDVRIRQTPTTP